MLSGRLVVDAPDHDALERLRGGVADIELLGVEAAVPGELLRVDLRPLAVAPVAALAAADPRADRTGPVIRVYIDQAGGGSYGEG